MAHDIAGERRFPAGHFELCSGPVFEQVGAQAAFFFEHLA